MGEGLLVYLAGKISKNGWRNKIVLNARDYNPDFKDVLLTRVEHVLTTGPFFISCDHGCYHGEESHGVGAYGQNDEHYPSGCTGERGIPQSAVMKICMEQILRSDFVFAYIDSDSCFGTLTEIGIAIGNKIPVAVMFANEELRAKMWFPMEASTIVFNKYGAVYTCKTTNLLLIMKASEIASYLALDPNDEEWCEDHE